MNNEAKVCLVGLNDESLPTDEEKPLSMAVATPEGSVYSFNATASLRIITCARGLYLTPSPLHFPVMRPHSLRLSS